MKQIGFIFLVVMSLILQLSFLPALRPFGVVPSLILVVIALIGLEGTASVAMICGVACGVAMDLASGANFGLWTVTLALAALVTGVLHRAGLETRAFIPGAAIVIGGTILTATVILLGLAGSVNYWPVGYILGTILLEIVLNLALLLCMRPLVRAVSVIPTRESAIW